VRSYKVEVLAPTMLTTSSGIQEALQAKIDAYAKVGWKLHSLQNLTGIGALSGASIGPYLILVFEGGS